MVEPLIRNDNRHGWSVYCRRYGCAGFWRCDLKGRADCEHLWVQHLKVCTGQDRYA